MSPEQKIDKPFIKSPMMTIPNDTTFIAVTADTWGTFQADIIDIEQASFPPPIRDTLEYLRSLAYSPKSIFLAAKARNSKIVGYIAADILENFADIPGVSSDPEFNNGTTMYIASVAVHPKWRKQGLGNALQKECITQAALRGFKRVTAHIRQSALPKLTLKTKALQSFSNWYNTNQFFDYVEFPIDSWR